MTVTAFLAASIRATARFALRPQGRSPDDNQ